MAVRPSTNVTGDDPFLTGKIALAHLNEFADYYTVLEKMERPAKRNTPRASSKKEVNYENSNGSTSLTNSAA